MGNWATGSLHGEPGTWPPVAPKPSAMLVTPESRRSGSQRELSRSHCIRCLWVLGVSELGCTQRETFINLCTKNSRRVPKSSNESHTMLLLEPAARIYTPSAQPSCSVTQHAGALTLQRVSGKALFVSGFPPAEFYCEIKILIFTSLWFYYLFNVMVNQVPTLRYLHPT